MVKILLQCTSDHHTRGYDLNLGGAAIISCSVQTLRQFFPDADFASLIQLSTPFSSRHRIRVVQNKLFLCKSYSFWESLKSSVLFLRCVLWAAIRRYLHLDLNVLINNRVLKEYAEASVIIDLSMDHFNDMFSILPVIEHARDMLIGRLLGKPVVVYAPSPGPFHSRLASQIARFALNRVSLITLREEISRSYLEGIGVNKPPIYVTADPAFLLPPADGKRIREILSSLGIENTRPIVGIAVPEEFLLMEQNWQSYKRPIRLVYPILRYLLPEKIFLWLTRIERTSDHLSGSRYTSYHREIAQVVDHLVLKLGSTVVLIPHTIMPDDYAEKKQDTRISVRAIHNLTSKRAEIIPIIGSYTAEEMKGIIGSCDLLISTKLHAAIASTSQCVPTILISSHHHKFQGIMKMLGQEEWVCNRLSGEDVIAMVDCIWPKREQIRNNLKDRIEAVKARSLLNGKLVKELLASSEHRTAKVENAASSSTSRQQPPE